MDDAPSAAVTGTEGTIDVSWSGLDATTRYLGAVSHSGPGGLMALTLVAVDATIPVPAVTVQARVPQAVPIVARGR